MTRMLMRPCARRMLLAGLLAALAACAGPTMQTVGIAKPDCSVFGPLTYAKADTDATIVEIKAHNAAWRAICGPSHQATVSAR